MARGRRRCSGRGLSSRYTSSTALVSPSRVSIAADCPSGSTQASAGPGAFVQVPPLENQRAKRESEYRIDYTQFPLSVIGEMLLKTCRSKVVEYSHPAVSLQSFEIIVRYHDFFKLCPEYIPQILPSFLDEQCVSTSS